MNYYVYILANVTGTTICIGVTRNLVRRVYEHKHKLDPNSFTAKYDVHKLVYFESTSDVRAAIEREKQLKGWNRKKKTSLWRAKILVGKIYTNRYCARGCGLPHQSADWFAMTSLSKCSAPCGPGGKHHARFF